MLEKLLEKISTVEKYTVGIADEGLAYLIDVPANWIEKKGIPRDNQASFLARTTTVGTMLAVWSNLLEGRLSNYIASGICNSPIAGLSAEDGYFLSNRAESCPKWRNCRRL